ncbi:hypothetical protein PspLS_07052 [Pyricularia sp. CBS 133598]|nr:hypothetical protein PspLS_07052 [Pyricularia sp. CBS 133598]
MARGRIYQCVWSHTRCQQGAPSTPRHLPPRIINLEAPPNRSSGSLTRILRTRPRADYAALSYCWGSGNTLRTTIGTLASDMSGIPIKNFPAGLQDATKTTVALGLRYLWIDCLCIIQDDAADWAAHSSHEMHTIYGKSTVTNLRHLLWDGGIPGGDSSTTAHDLATYLIPPIRSWDLNVDATPLSQRGWALQERLLPRRLLHFGARRGRYGAAHLVCRTRAAWELAAGIKSLESVTNVLFQWYGILRLYSRRRLTRALDKMPAIIGIVKVFAGSLATDLCGSELGSQRIPILGGRMLPMEELNLS